MRRKLKPSRLFLALALAVICSRPAGQLAAGELPRGQAFVNSIGIKLVRIEAGKFVMGSGDAPPRTREEWNERDWDEAPAHRVTISRPLFMGATEVTNAQYEQYAPEHKKLRGRHGVSRTDDQPVVMVSWQQAIDFCHWLTKKEGRRYRLP